MGETTNWRRISFIHSMDTGLIKRGTWKSTSYQRVHPIYGDLFGYPLVNKEFAIENGDL
jgi:hypothetical protein